MKETAENEQKEEGKEPFDGEYIGNIWGWRFSLAGLALILVMCGIMVYRHHALGVPFSGEALPEPEQTEMPADSSRSPESLETGSLPARQQAPAMVVDPFSQT